MCDQLSEFGELSWELTNGIEDGYLSDYCSLEYLWHYSTANGLCGILNSNNEDKKLTFWFTRSDCLNDTSEGKDIERCFAIACKDLHEAEQISDDFYQVICGCKVSDKQFIFYPITSSYNGIALTSYEAYICCFSLNEDSLDMWRYYSKGDGGYAIKLRGDFIDEYMSHLGEASQYGYSMCSYKVLYDLKEKVEYLKKLILKIYSDYNKNKDTDRGEKACNIMEEVLQELQFFYKHECFATEQEYRFVIFQPTSAAPDLSKKLFPVKFRVSNGVPVPYIEVNLSTTDCIDSIKISPLVTDEHTEAAINKLVNQKGISAAVTRSVLPVRF